jgi:hypothetical protein
MESTTTLNLSQFTGTTSYYPTFVFTPKLHHTDGVEYFAENAGCYWFLDIVATEIYPLLKREPFIGITLFSNDGKAKIVANDGDDKTIFKKNIDYTNCPVGNYHFFLTDNVLMLTSEY